MSYSHPKNPRYIEDNVKINSKTRKRLRPPRQVKCHHCGHLYPEKLDRCVTCQAKKPAAKILP